MGGNCPGIGGTSPRLQPDGGLPSPVFGRFAVTGLDPALLNSDDSGLVALVALVGLCANVFPRGVRGFGLERPDGDLLDDAAFSLSSVARRRASRASSSEVWEDTAFFLLGLAEKLVRWIAEQTGAHFSSTAASKSARLSSILKRSFRAREKERAIVL